MSKQATLENLRTMLHRIEEQYLADRSALERAIEIAQRDLDDEPQVPARIQSSLKKKPVSERKDTPNGKHVPLLPVEAVSARQAVREAIEKMSGPFSLHEIRGYIRHTYPVLAQSVADRTIGARLSEAYSDSIITQVKKGKGGQPSVYEKTGRVVQA